MKQKLGLTRLQEFQNPEKDGYMSVLKPVGVPIVLGGEERHFLFTLNAIDAIQTHYDATMVSVFERLSENETIIETTKFLVSALLTDEYEREKFKDPNTTMRPVTEHEAGWLVSKDNLYEVSIALAKAYGLSMPEDDSDPNLMSGQTNS